MDLELISGIKQGQKMMWSSGDYPDIAKFLMPATDEVVKNLAVGEGQALLDVATGSGNLAVVAAQRGADVTGLDITPELLVVARERAAAAGVEIEFLEGDAEELPYDDDSFDRVASIFGMIFAPRHDLAAAEIVRVCKPGGRFAVTSWSAGGMNGTLFSVIGKFMPPPPPGMQTVVAWGQDEHAREMFAAAGVEVTIERHMADFYGDSVEEWVDYNSEALGPMILARNALEPQGKWEALREDLITHYRKFNVADDGSFRGPAEYLLISGEKPVFRA
ncbi:MAG: methyltransferase domain-containing protein [Solirubrobacterales bacterium]